MHFRITVTTATRCKNIKPNLRPLLIRNLKNERNYVKSTSKVTEGDIKKQRKNVSPIALPPANSTIDSTKIKKKVSLWDNLPGAEKLIRITDKNFDEVIKAHNSLLIMFYGSWCSVCKDVNVEIARAAVKLSPSEGVLGICDAMENVGLVDRYLIRKTPSLKYFHNGLHVADYIGKPLASDIITFMRNPPKAVKINK